MKKNGNWTAESLRRAISDIDEGVSIRAASRNHGIPASSLRDHLMGRTVGRHRGRPGVLSSEEEGLLVQWVSKMQDIGHPVTITQCRLKVAEITQFRATPFQNGVPGQGWVKWFRRRHPELTLRHSQGLEAGRARGLCPDSVASFYANLSLLYDTHGYGAHQVWNCDESGAQAGRNGGGLVLAKTWSRCVHTVMPDQREWLSVLACMNAAGDYIPNFYIFKGKRFGRNFIEKCEVGATMAMQPRAWMTGILFSKWLSHFIEAVKQKGGISSSCRHLLILDGHNSHVTLDAVRQARDAGLDMLTLPSHTSHALQPLDVSIFKPFKTAFRMYRDVWSLSHKGHPATKEVLAQWVSLSLKKAMTQHNIKKGFEACGIWPLNNTKMDGRMQPSECFRVAEEEAIFPEGVERVQQELAGLVIQEVTGDLVIPETQPDMSPPRQYFVAEAVDDDGNLQLPASDVARAPAECTDLHSNTPNCDEPSIMQFLSLPKHVQPAPRPRSDQPIVDHSRSIILTTDDYLDMMAEKTARKNRAVEEREKRRCEAEGSKRRREAQKSEAAAEKIKRREDRERKKAYDAMWTPAACAAAGDRLHAFINQAVPRQESLRELQVRALSTPLCRENMRIAIERRRCKKAGVSTEHLSALIEPLCVHRASVVSGFRS